MIKSNVFISQVRDVANGPLVYWMWSFSGHPLYISSLFSLPKVWWGCTWGRGAKITEHNSPVGARISFMILLPPGIQWPLSGTLPGASIGAEHFLIFTIIWGIEGSTQRLGAVNRWKLAPIWSPGPLSYTPTRGYLLVPEWHTSKFERQAPRLELNIFYRFQLS